METLYGFDKKQIAKAVPDAFKRIISELTALKKVNGKDMKHKYACFVAQEGVHFEVTAHKETVEGDQYQLTNRGKIVGYFSEKEIPILTEQQIEDRLVF